jgi:hypothetical protein
MTSAEVLNRFSTRPRGSEGGSKTGSLALPCHHLTVSTGSRLAPRASSPLDQKFLPKVDLPGPKRGEGRPNRFWQQPTPLSIGKCFVLAAHPRRGVPRFFSELASNLVVIVNKTYARNHVYGGLALTIELPLAPTLFPPNLVAAIPASQLIHRRIARCSRAFLEQSDDGKTESRRATVRAAPVVSRLSAPRSIA